MAIWASSSAKTIRVPLSERMKATSSPVVEGYTAVVAAPAHMIARSAYSHSMRVLEAMATRCSGWIPRASSPAASVLTVSAVWAQVTEVHPVSVGNRNASARGVAATLS